MSYTETNNEDAAMEAAVNEAARETHEADVIEIATTEPRPAILRTGEPDLSIHIDSDPSIGIYRYVMFDRITRLAHRAAGRLKGAEETALVLYATTGSLKSIMRNRVTEALCARYGFSTRTAALRSEKNLMVELAVTDAAVAELGKTISDGAKDNVVSFLPLKADREPWRLAAIQFARFDIRWTVIGTESPSLVDLRDWAGRVMRDCPHSGPILDCASRRAYVPSQTESAA